MHPKKQLRGRGGLVETLYHDPCIYIWLPCFLEVVKCWIIQPPIFNCWLGTGAIYEWMDARWIYMWMNIFGWIYMWMKLYVDEWMSWQTVRWKQTWWWGRPLPFVSLWSINRGRVKNAVNLKVDICQRISFFCLFTPMHCERVWC